MGLITKLYEGKEISKMNTNTFFNEVEDMLKDNKQQLKKVKRYLSFAASRRGEHFNCNIYLAESGKVFDIDHTISSRQNKGWQLIELTRSAKGYWEVLDSPKAQSLFVSYKQLERCNGNINIEFITDDGTKFVRACKDKHSGENWPWEGLRWTDSQDDYTRLNEDLANTLVYIDFLEMILQKKEEIEMWMHSFAETRKGSDDDALEFCKKFAPHRVEYYNSYVYEKAYVYGKIGDSLQCTLHIILDSLQGIKGKLYFC